MGASFIWCLYVNARGFFKLLPIDPFLITSFKILRCHLNVLRLLFLYFMLHLIGIFFRNVKEKLTIVISEKERHFYVFRNKQEPYYQHIK